MDRLVVATLASVALVAPAAGAPQPSVCRFTSLQNHVLAPVDLTFPINATGVSANVTIDDSTGSFALDGGSIVVPPYPMPFSDANDVLVFENRVVAGTIDRSGSVTVPGVNFTICTGGTPAGTDCVPSNMCSNDTSRICITGAGGGTGCDAPGVCQGVCRDDRTHSCASNADCGPGGFCGTGTLVPFRMDFTTGTSGVGDVTVMGSQLDFATGSISLNFAEPTPAESPIIGDSGITSLLITCTLDPIPAADTLPAPPSWQVLSGKAKLARNGTPGAGDDRLTLKAVFAPLAGQADFTANDLRLTLANGSTTVLVLRVPAGSLRTRGKKLLGSAVQVTPAGGGTTPTHTVTLVHRKDTYKVTVVSKNVDLDDLASATSVVSTVQLGFQSASATEAARATKHGVNF